MARLDEIRERLAAATPGAWRYKGFGGVMSSRFGLIADNIERADDGEFIANARDDIAYLLAEVERLRGLVLSGVPFFEDDEDDVLLAYGEAPAAGSPDEVVR